MTTTTSTDTGTTSRPQDRRAETSPRNGARSRGPKTESGKKKSSGNSLKHGLYSRHIVLGSESQDEYDAHKDYYLETYAPANPEEFDLVMDMVNARWLLRRVERHEKALFQVELSRAVPSAKDEFQDPDPEVVEALAWQALAASRTFENLNRMAQRYERTYYRAKAALEGGSPGPLAVSKPAKGLEPITPTSAELAAKANEPTADLSASSSAQTEDVTMPEPSAPLAPASSSQNPSLLRQLLRCLVIMLIAIWLTKLPAAAAPRRTRITATSPATQRQAIRLGRSYPYPSSAKSIQVY